MATYDAILPAGGTIEEGFAKVVGTSNKSLINIEGKTILERTLDALAGSGRIGRKVVIGPPEVHIHPGVKGADILLEPGASGPDNIFRGLEVLLKTGSPPDKVVIVTTDLPFLTPELINRFIDSCPTDKDIAIPLVSKTVYQERFPNSVSTFIQLKDDSWTAGNIYLLDVKALQRIRPSIERIFDNRKSKIGMAKMLGPVFLVKYLRRTLTVPDIEKKIQSLLGCTGSAIMNSSPELAYDIDYQDDYDYAMEVLGGHA